MRSRLHNGVDPMLIRLIPVYGGDANVVAVGIPLFAGIVPPVIRRLLGDYWKYMNKTLFKADCLGIFVFFNMCVRSLFPPEEY